MKDNPFILFTQKSDWQHFHIKQTLYNSIVNSLKNQLAFAVYFLSGCVILLGGRKPSCIVCLVRQKISSQIL